MVAALSVAALPAAIAAGGSESSPVAWAFFSEVSGDGRVVFFGNQRDAVQEQRFVTEGAISLDFALASRGERWWVRSRFTLQSDFGESVADNLPFSPINTAYEVIPFVEYRRDAWLARAGWNHACQHLIYKENDAPWYLEEDVDVPPDAYYNRIFIGAGHREIRPELLRETFFENRKSAERPRVMGYVEAGGYLRKLPGMDRDSLYGGNDWVADVRADLRLRLLTGNRWVLLAISQTHLLLDGQDDVFARQRFQLEGVFATRGFGSSIFVGAYPLDEHPRDSKDGMLELGAQFTF